MTRVESAFRLMKSELGLRPFYHSREFRCDGHVWLTILAYHLLHWVECMLKLAGYDITWQRFIFSILGIDPHLLPIKKQRFKK